MTIYPVDTPLTDPAACGGNRYAVPATHVAKKELLAIALTAYAAEKKIKFIIANGSCVGSDPRINSIRTQN